MSRRSFLTLLLPVLFHLWSVDAVLSHGTSPIAIENARPGDPSWVLVDPADHEIEGYASATSINRGESLRLYVHTTDPSFSQCTGWAGTAGPAPGW